MDEEALLQVSFAIDMNDSLGQLKTLDDFLGEAAAQAVREFQRIENASKGAIQMGNATAQIAAFGNAASRELASVARENAKVERSGEGIVRQMNRQIEVFGKNASEIRQMRAEIRAVEADSRGFTELAGRIRAASAELDRLEAGGAGFVRNGASVTASAGQQRIGMQQLGFQINDVATMYALGARPMQIFASQSGQVVQSVQMMAGGTSKLAGFMGGPWGVAITAATIVLAPLVAKLFEAEKAMEQVKLASTGLSDAQGVLGDMFDLTTGKIKDQNQVLRLNAELQAMNLRNAAMEARNAARDAAKDSGQYSWGALWSGNIPLRKMFDVRDTEALTRLQKLVNETDPQRVAKLARETRAWAESADFSGVDLSKGEYMQALADATTAASKDATAAMIEESLAGNRLVEGLRQTERVRTGSADKHAESLMRDAKATEAQIGNLYALTDAYRISGAQALVAAAQVAAESKAIRKRGDVSAAVERQIRLEIAQRVSNAARATASVRDQAEAQRKVNELVAGGLVPAERAAKLVQDQIADLPLVAALKVATEKGYADALDQATRALNEQRKARADLRAEETKAAGMAAIEGADDQITMLKEELRLAGKTVEVRERELALFKAMQEARGFTDGDMHTYISRQAEISDLQRELTERQNAFNQELSYTADLFAAIDDAALDAARGMSDAFGSVGRAMGDALTTLTGYHAAEERLLAERAEYIRAAGEDEAAINRANRLYAIRSASLQVGAFGDMADAAKGFFKEGTAGYKAMETAEKAFRAVEFAMSVRAIAQDAIETGSKIANSVARTAQFAVEAVVKAIKELPWPINLVAGAATAGAIAALGVSIAGSFGGGGSAPEPANEGKGTTFGDPEAQSQSIKRSIDALREVDILTATYSREMLGSLRSIDSQIGGLANVLIRTGNVDANFDIAEGFKSDTIGKVLKGVITGGGLFTKIPIIGDIIGGIGSLIGSLFGSKTSVTGSGLYAGPQSLGSILSGGFDASYYTDIKKKKKFFGITTGTSYRTEYQNASGELENEFTLILRGFSDAIAAAAGPLGFATSDIANRLNNFVVEIGKIDTRNMTGAELQDKLTAIFGAAADRMASTAFPVIVQFQKAGEGAFETMVRVASTVETVTGLFEQLGRNMDGLDIKAQMDLVDQFGGLEDLTSATQAYFDTFYTREEQAQARLAQFTSAFERMGITLPDTLAGFRALVEAQDLTTAAGRETYAMLLQVAPAFADLKSALDGARTAADILAEKQDLERRLLELQGNTEALRALDLAKLDESNRALQEQIWAIEDAQEAAQAAQQLADAWSSVGTSIMDEVRRIRGLTGTEEGGSFATLMGQFNAATAAARGGDLDAAKSLPGLSQALIKAAELAATSRQELDRVQAQTAASLEATNAAIAALATASGSDEAVAAAAAAAAQATGAGTSESPTETMRLAFEDMRDELAALRAENNAGHAANASNTGAIKRKLDDVTAASGGDAISTVQAA